MHIQQLKQAETMKHTILKLNPMPKRGTKPPSIPDDRLIILTNPEKNVVYDTIRPAADVDWAARNATHFIVLVS